MKVKFLPQNIEVEIKPNESVLTVAQDNDIYIQSVCKGIPSCAECRVYIKEGETNVVPPLQPELELIGTAYYIDQRRLSCQLRCFGDVVVDLTEQIEKQNKSTKNPQGRYVKEREDSHARMGNILEELADNKLPDELLGDISEEDLEPIRPTPARSASQSQQNTHSEQNRSRNHQRQEGRGSGERKEGRRHGGGGNRNAKANNGSNLRGSDSKPHQSQKNAEGGGPEEKSGGNPGGGQKRRPNNRKRKRFNKDSKSPNSSQNNKPQGQS